MIARINAVAVTGRTKKWKGGWKRTWFARVCGSFSAIVVSLWSKVYSTKRSEEHTSELQSLRHLVCRLLLEKKNARLTFSRFALPYDAFSLTQRLHAHF